MKYRGYTIHLLDGTNTLPVTITHKDDDEVIDVASNEDAAKALIDWWLDAR